MISYPNNLLIKDELGVFPKDLRQMLPLLAPTISSPTTTIACLHHVGTGHAIYIENIYLLF